MESEDKFIIGTMKWSFSRINGFYNNCKREWYHHYVLCDESSNSFDGQVGGFAHEILEKFFKKELSAFDLAPYFEEHYKEKVTIPCPYPNGDTKYEKILEYFENFDFPIDDYEILGVEKQINIKINNKYDCIGFIDVLLKNKETGEITLMDHKSSSIKVLKNGNISKSDQEHFDAFKKQQYLYSRAVIDEYEVKPSYLSWNMFKDGTSITIPWEEEEMQETLDWAYDTIVAIENETEYLANPGFYYCSNLCSIRGNCECPYKRLGMIYDGIYSKCYNPKNANYAEYGGSFVGMDDSWKEDKQEFFKWSLENGYADDLILKRYDELDNFYPENCYWDVRPMEEEYGYNLD